MVASFVPLITVPMLLHNMGTAEYAVWATITALLNWIGLFDFGIGYGVKNRTSESFAFGSSDSLTADVIGTLQMYLVLTAVLAAIFVASLFYLNVFVEHRQLALILYAPVIVAFPFTLGNFLLQAASRFNLLNVLLLFQGLAWLALVILNNFGILRFSLPQFGASYGILYFATNVLIFGISMKVLGVSIKAIRDWKHFSAQRKHISTGLRFFSLQIAALFLYSIGNILAYDHLDLTDVTRYDIINKMYLMGVTLFNIIISIFWVEISKSKAMRAVSRLYLLRKQLLVISGSIAAVCFISIPLVAYLIRFWTGQHVIVENRHLIAFAALASVQCIAYSGAVFLNAFERLKGQIIFSLVGAVCMIPLSKLLFSLGLQLNAVPLASAILTFPTLVYVVYMSKKCIDTLKDTANTPTV